MSKEIFQLFLEARRQGFNYSYEQIKEAWLEEQEEIRNQQEQIQAMENFEREQNLRANIEAMKSNAEMRRCHPNQPRERYSIGLVLSKMDVALICGDISDEEYNRVIGISQIEYERTYKQEEEIQAMGRRLSRVGLL